MMPEALPQHCRPNVCTRLMTIHDVVDVEDRRPWAYRAKVFAAVWCDENVGDLRQRSSFCRMRVRGATSRRANKPHTCVLFSSCSNQPPQHNSPQWTDSCCVRAARLLEHLKLLPGPVGTRTLITINAKSRVANTILQIMRRKTTAEMTHNCVTTNRIKRCNIWPDKRNNVLDFTNAVNSQTYIMSRSPKFASIA